MLPAICASANFIWKHLSLLGSPGNLVSQHMTVYMFTKNIYRGDKIQKFPLDNADITSYPLRSCNSTEKQECDKLQSSYIKAVHFLEADVQKIPHKACMTDLLLHT